MGFPPQPGQICGKFVHRPQLLRMRGTPTKLQFALVPRYVADMSCVMIEKRFRCMAEQRATRFGITLEYEDLGDRLMELRRIAWDRYGAQALWSVPPHATFDSMHAVIDGLRSYGDLEAAYLAAAILREIECRTDDAA